MIQRKRPPVRRKRRTTGRKRSGGHGLLFAFLFFIAVALGAAYTMSDPAPAKPAASVSQTSPVEQVLDTFRSGEETVKEAISHGAEKAAGKEKDSLDRAAVSAEKEPAAPKASAGSSDASRAAPSSPAAAPAPAAPAAVKGKLAVVIDDAGRDLASQRVYEHLGIPLTLAVMPNQSHTGEAAAEWAAAGLPVIIHQPMESVSGSGMEPIVLLTSMSDEEKRTLISDSVRQIPQAVGMNNHQGSKATIDRHTMDVVMKELSHRGMFFLDSATNTTTEADKAAAAYGVGYARNELFVDNSTDVGEIKAMIRKGARMAAASGTAIIIGHCRPHTAEAFRQVVPELEAEGIRFIYVSSLMH